MVGLSRNLAFDWRQAGLLWQWRLRTAFVLMIAHCRMHCIAPRVEANNTRLNSWSSMKNWIKCMADAVIPPDLKIFFARRRNSAALVITFRHQHVTLPTELWSRGQQLLRHGAESRRPDCCLWYHVSNFSNQLIFELRNWKYQIWILGGSDVLEIQPQRIMTVESKYRVD
jgi:hypothetical protein